VRGFGCVVYSTLKSVCDGEGREITFTYDDVYNKYKLSAEEKMMDASNLTAWLEERHAIGQPAKVYLSAAGQLERVFYVLDDAIDVWAIAPNDNIVIYDTTANTNRSGMKLGCGTTVDQTGKTRLLFVSLVVYQDAESFQWVFEQMQEAFRTPPRVVFTDSDKAMQKAIGFVWPSSSSTVHLLCTWHLSKNLFTNMKGTAGSAWHAFLRCWWGICKKTEFTAR
jgi:hypothetical protein